MFGSCCGEISSQKKKTSCPVCSLDLGRDRVAGNKPRVTKRKGLIRKANPNPSWVKCHCLGSHQCFMRASSNSTKHARETLRIGPDVSIPSTWWAEKKAGPRGLPSRSARANSTLSNATRIRCQSIRAPVAKGVNGLPKSTPAGPNHCFGGHLWILDTVEKAGQGPGCCTPSCGHCFEVQSMHWVCRKKARIPVM